jgi:Protein of unknown function (DUF3223)
LDGAKLNKEDEELVIEKLLAYHPHSEDKIGCGLQAIMVCFHYLLLFFLISFDPTSFLL